MKDLPGGVLVAGLLLVIELEVLRALQDRLDDRLAAGALELQHHLLRRLCLLVEDRLRLTTITRLLPVVATLTTSVQASLAGLVLHHLKALMGVAALVGAVQRLLLWEVHHCAF